MLGTWSRRQAAFGRTFLVFLIALLAGCSATPTTDIPGTRSEEPKVPAPVQEDAPDKLSAWLNTVDRDLPERGDGRIWGRIALADGTPVPNVEVRVFPLPASSTRPNDAPSLEDAITRSARNLSFQFGYPEVAMTDTAGHYELTGIGAYHCEIRPRLIGYVFDDPSGLSMTANVQDDEHERNLVAVPLCPVRISVKMPNGSKPESVRVQACTSDTHKDRWWFSPEVEDVLSAGRWSVKVHAGEHQQYVAEQTNILFTPGEATVDIQFVLTLQPGLHVNMLFRDAPCARTRAA
jgi:hypothetical protein